MWNAVLMLYLLNVFLSCLLAPWLNLLLGLDSSSGTSVVRSFLLLCCLTVFMMKSLGQTFCCRAARIYCFLLYCLFHLR